MYQGRGSFIKSFVVQYKEIWTVIYSILDNNISFTEFHQQTVILLKYMIKGAELVMNFDSTSLLRPSADLFLTFDSSVFIGWHD